MTGTAITPKPTHEEIAANRQVWLAALRSGNYPQARQALRTVNGFCCLGVAEDVLDCSWEPVSAEFAQADYRAVRFTGGFRTSALTTLTSTTALQLGLETTTPNVVVWSTSLGAWCVTTLISINDTYRFTLDQIADVIEDQGPDWNGYRYRSTLLREARDVGHVIPRPGLPVIV